MAIKTIKVTVRVDHNMDTQPPLIEGCPEGYVVEVQYQMLRDPAWRFCENRDKCLRRCGSKNPWKGSGPIDEEGVCNETDGIPGSRAVPVPEDFEFPI